MADVGTGTTLTFGTTSYTAAIEGIEIDGFARAVIDVAHMGTAGARDKIVGDLYEPPVLTVTAQFNPNDPAPYSAAAETVTVTFPIPSGLTNGATMAGSAAVTQVGISVPLEDKMMSTFQVQYLGDITFADAS